MSGLRVVEIPFTPRPQRFNIVLASVTYSIRLYWLAPAQCWVIDVWDQFQNPLINGIPLVSGADLLGQFQSLLPGGMIVLTEPVQGQVPGWADLGITGRVYYRAPQGP